MDGEHRYYYNRYGTQIAPQIAKKLPTVYDSKGNVIPLQNSDGVTTLASKSKRNLSSSSTSSPSTPSHNEKKSKFFVSPNRFASLPIDDDSNDEAFLVSCDNSSTVNAVRNCISNQQHAKPATTLPPPIYVKNVSDITLFKNSLSSMIDINRLSFKATRLYLSVRPKDADSFDAVINFLRETSFGYHSFLPSHLRPFRVVIKNLHHTTPTPDISEALATLGHTVTRVSNISKRNIALPLFYVDLKPAENNNDIFNVSSLFHTLVKIEKPYKVNRIPPQCHNCQEYGHTRRFCGHRPRYVKCGCDHLTSECSKDSSCPAKCALCGGDHTANFKGCPSFKTLRKYQPSIHRMPQKLKPSYPSNTNSNPNPNSKPKSYAHVLSGSENNNINISDIETLLSKFFLNFTAIINPLISLLSTALNKINLP
ncbi:Uncharacterized protein FWK35_00013313 [Aphis craccivora]|uniref:Pre-C2HC domain-containing protein n=1 Tax=Aphis craccivora TaxID=307492 RepID=A0A6G0YP77_APHCR|nr:Uncharacterized protein FWK35_00013313 [Aphis craccivora]